MRGWWSCLMIHMFINILFITICTGHSLSYQSFVIWSCDFCRIPILSQLKTDTRMTWHQSACCKYFFTYCVCIRLIGSMHAVAYPICRVTSPILNFKAPLHAEFLSQFLSFWPYICSIKFQKPHIFPKHLKINTLCSLTLKCLKMKI